LKFCAVYRHRVTFADIVGHHLVIQDARIAFRNGDQTGDTGPAFDNRQIFQVCTDKIPGTFFGGSFLLETVFKSAVWLIGGDDEVLFDCGRTNHRMQTTSRLVQGSNGCNDKPDIRKSSLNAIPYACLGIGELNCHPSTRLENPISLHKTSGHQLSVFIDPLLLKLTFNSLEETIRKNSKPCLSNKTQLGVHDVRTKGWIKKNVVNGTSWNCD